MARVKSIKLNSDGDPRKVCLVLTAEEALFLTRLSGAQFGATANEVLTNGGEINEEVYDCLTGNLWNRFYSGGADEAAQQHEERSK
jgi:hypothetical protein